MASWWKSKYEGATRRIQGTFFLCLKRIVRGQLLVYNPVLCLIQCNQSKSYIQRIFTSQIDENLLLLPDIQVTTSCRQGNAVIPSCWQGNAVTLRVPLACKNMQLTHRKRYIIRSQGLSSFADSDWANVFSRHSITGYTFL